MPPAGNQLYDSESTVVCQEELLEDFFYYLSFLFFLRVVEVGFCNGVCESFVMCFRLQRKLTDDHPLRYS